MDESVRGGIGKPVAVFGDDREQSDEQPVQATQPLLNWFLPVAIPLAAKRL